MHERPTIRSEWNEWKQWKTMVELRERERESFSSYFVYSRSKLKHFDIHLDKLLSVTVFKTLRTPRSIWISNQCYHFTHSPIHRIPKELLLLLFPYYIFCSLYQTHGSLYFSFLVCSMSTTNFRRINIFRSLQLLFIISWCLV